YSDPSSIKPRPEEPCEARRLEGRPPGPRSSFLPLDDDGTANVALQEKHAVEQRLRGRRTAGNVDVDRNDAVAPSHHRIGVVVVAAAIGARSHGNDVARLLHLVIDLAQGRGHLVA